MKWLRISLDIAMYVTFAVAAWGVARWLGGGTWASVLCGMAAGSIYGRVSNSLEDEWPEILKRSGF